MNSLRKKDKEAQFVQYFGPVLNALRKLGDSGSPDEVLEQIVQDLQISDEIQNELMASGEPRFRNQVHWARFYLAKEGLIDSSKRGIWRLTDAGRNTTLSPEQSRDIFLKWVRFYQEERRNKKIQIEEPRAEQATELLINEDYKSDFIEFLLKLPPSGFERLSQRVLREAGFSQVIVTGKSGDEGIDGHGTLHINELVSFRVMFQCKRYRKSVSSGHVRDFRGAMAGRADKGIIITTGSFTADAKREASRDGVTPIELVDGEKLVELMERLELGLKPVKTYEIDESFFTEFRDP